LNPLSYKNETLYTWFLSSCSSHSTSYMKTPAITVAILKSTELGIFHYSSFKSQSLERAAQN